MTNQCRRIAGFLIRRFAGFADFLILGIIEIYIIFCVLFPLSLFLEQLLILLHLFMPSFQFTCLVILFFYLSVCTGRFWGKSQPSCQNFRHKRQEFVIGDTCTVKISHYRIGKSTMRKGSSFWKESFFPKDICLWLWDKTNRPFLPFVYLGWNNKNDIYCDILLKKNRLSRTFVTLLNKGNIQVELSVLAKRWKSKPLGKSILKGKMKR